MSTSLQHLKSPAELAERHPHGTRMRYLGGCRCVDCRKANSLYSVEREKAVREGRGNPIVDAAPARAHIIKLSKKGVGFRSVAKRAGISKTIVAAIKSGDRPRIRRQTLELILSITPDMKAPSSLIPADRTWRLINELLEEGYTRQFLAQQLGCACGQLQISKHRIKVSTAKRIEDLHRRLTA